MALESTQPLTEMSTRTLPGGKGRLAHKADNLTAICEPTIPVTGHGGPWGSQTLRLPHFLDNRLTNGSEVVSHTHQMPFTPRMVPGTHLC
jgi:hypothetical protein